MPYSSIGQVPTQVATHKGTELTLAQANKWASIFDAIKSQGGVDSPAAVAWSSWEKLYVKEGDQWVLRKKAESEIKADVKLFISLAGEIASQDADRDFYLVSDTAHKLINDILDSIEIPRSIKIQMINGIIDEIPGILKEKVMDVIMSSVRAGDLEIYKELQETGQGQGVGKPKQGTGGVDSCKCPECSHVIKHERGTPCVDIKCPKCGANMEPDSNSYADLTEIKDMAVFKVGTHNGDKYDEGTLDSIISNFKKLYDSIRPKLKITHKETQETLAGLASYGDIAKVFMKVVDGIKHIYVDVINVPQVVADWVKDRRFPERSVEIYPKIEIGGESFFNVLRNVSLLGCEPPAVPGLEPIKLDDGGTEYDTCIMNFEVKSKGKGGEKDMPDDIKKAFEATITKLKSEIKAKDVEITKMTDEKNEVAVVKLQEVKTKLTVQVTKLEADVKVFQDQAVKGKKAEDDLKKFKEDKKASFISNAIDGWKESGQVLPAEEPGIKSLMETLSDDEVITCTVADGDSGTKEVKKSALQMFKDSVDNRNKKVDFKEISGQDINDLPGVQKLQIKDSEGKVMPVDGEDIDVKARKYMKDNPTCSYEEAIYTVSPDQNQG